MARSVALGRGAGGELDGTAEAPVQARPVEIAAEGEGETKTLSRLLVAEFALILVGLLVLTWIV